LVALGWGGKKEKSCWQSRTSRSRGKKGVRGQQLLYTQNGRSPKNAQGVEKGKKQCPQGRRASFNEFSTTEGRDRKGNGQSGRVQRPPSSRRTWKIRDEKVFSSKKERPPIGREKKNRTKNDKKSPTVGKTGKPKKSRSGLKVGRGVGDRVTDRGKKEKKPD